MFPKSGKTFWKRNQPWTWFSFSAMKYIAVRTHLTLPARFRPCGHSGSPHSILLTSCIWCFPHFKFWKKQKETERRNRRAAWKKHKKFKNPPRFLFSGLLRKKIRNGNVFLEVFEIFQISAIRLRVISLSQRRNEHCLLMITWRRVFFVGKNASLFLFFFSFRRRAFYVSHTLLLRSRPDLFSQLLLH